MKKYKVILTESERQLLTEVVKRGKNKATKLVRALIFLGADESEDGKKMTDLAISEAYGRTVRGIEGLRKRFVIEGLDSVLNGKKRKPRIDKKVDGDVEAHIIAVSRSSPPKGNKRWTLMMIAREVEKRGVIGCISHTTVSKVLKKTR